MRQCSPYIIRIYRKEIRSSQNSGQWTASRGGVYAETGAGVGAGGEVAGGEEGGQPPAGGGLPGEAGGQGSSILTQM